MPVIDLTEIRTEKDAEKEDGFLKRTGKKVRRKFRQGLDWVKDNPEAATLIFAAGSATVGGITKIGKTIHRNHAIREQRYLKERFVYDRSMDMYLKTRRPLNAKDWNRVNMKRKQGKKTAEALFELGLLDN